jgi:hypothetical protein
MLPREELERDMGQSEGDESSTNRNSAVLELII